MRLSAGLAPVDVSALALGPAGAGSPLDQLVALVEGQVGGAVVPSRIYLSRPDYEALRDACLATAHRFGGIEAVKALFKTGRGPYVAPLLPRGRAVYLEGPRPGRRAARAVPKAPPPAVR